MSAIANEDATKLLASAWEGPGKCTGSVQKVHRKYVGRQCVGSAQEVCGECLEIAREEVRMFLGGHDGHPKDG